jgi:hypothetical protein
MSNWINEKSLVVPPIQRFLDGMYFNLRVHPQCKKNASNTSHPHFAFGHPWHST